MELSERIIEKLEKEGYESIYEWQDPAGTTYPVNSHEKQFTMLVTDGLIIVDFAGQKEAVFTDQRIDIPAGKPFSAVVGDQGVIYIAGEK